MEPNKFISEHIENLVLTLNSEYSSSEDSFDAKLQEKFDKSDQIFGQPEE